MTERFRNIHTLVFELIVSIIMLGLIPWAYTVQQSLANIETRTAVVETKLDQIVELRQDYRELVKRVQKIELKLAKLINGE